MQSLLYYTLCAWFETMRKYGSSDSSSSSRGDVSSHTYDGFPKMFSCFYEGFLKGFQSLVSTKFDSVCRPLSTKYMV